MNLKYEKQINDRQKKDAGPLEGVLANLIQRYFKDKPGPLLIAVGGAGGTGKSTFSKKLAATLCDAVVLHLDDYKTCRHFRKKRGIFGPHPEANEMDLIREHLTMITQGKSIDKPIYCSQVGRATKTEKLSPKRFNVIEGEVATYKEFADIIDFHIFIDADLETQLRTRMDRDVNVRGHSKEKAITTFWGSNVDEFEKYGFGSRSWADIILFCDKDYVLNIHEVSSSLHDYVV